MKLTVDQIKAIVRAVAHANCAVATVGMADCLTGFDVDCINGALNLDPEWDWGNAILAQAAQMIQTQGQYHWGIDAAKGSNIPTVVFTAIKERENPDKPFQMVPGMWDIPKPSGDKIQQVMDALTKKPKVLAGVLSRLLDHPIAGPWQDKPGHDSWTQRVAVGGPLQGRVCAEAQASFEKWKWGTTRLDTSAGPGGQSANLTKEVAMQRADAQLIKAGWVLLGPDTPESE